jgi:hypothetical protein
VVQRLGVEEHGAKTVNEQAGSDKGFPGACNTPDIFPAALAWTMHEGTTFHGHACKFGDVEA